MKTVKTITITLDKEINKKLSENSKYTGISKSRFISKTLGSVLGKIEETEVGFNNIK